MHSASRDEPLNMIAKTALGREPNRPWGRLKNVKYDPLESIGLPSKGDKRHAATEPKRQRQELMLQ